MTLSQGQGRMEHMLEATEGAQVMTEFTQVLYIPAVSVRYRGKAADQTPRPTKAPLKAQCHVKVK